MDDNHHIQIMGITSDEDGSLPLTVFMEVDPHEAEIVNAHSIQNRNKEPIIKHLGLYFDPGTQYELDG